MNYCIPVFLNFFNIFSKNLLKNIPTEVRSPLASLFVHLAANNIDILEEIADLFSLDDFSKLLEIFSELPEQRPLLFDNACPLKNWNSDVLNPPSYFSHGIVELFFCYY